MPESTSFDSQELRRALGVFATGVTVVTTVTAEGAYAGVTASSFNSVSLDPPLILWSLALKAQEFTAFRAAEWFAVNILAVDQVAVSERFATAGVDKFAGVPIELGLGGVPLLACAGVLECRAEAAFPGGDHVIFVGRVERLRRTDQEPLIFWGGGYRAVGGSLPRP